MKSCIIAEGKYKVKFSGDDFSVVLNAIKALPQNNRFFSAKDRTWVISINPTADEVLTSLGFSIPKTFTITATEEKKDWKNIQVPEVPGVRPYQIDCLKFLTYRNGTGLILDEQGVGKTIESLAWLRIHPEKRPAVIIVKSTLKKQWAEKGKEWVPGVTYHIINGQTPDILPAVDCYIINWEIMTYWEEMLELTGVKVVIGDEVQMMGNYTAKRTKAVMNLVKNTGADWIGLSGTPIRTRVLQFFPSLTLTAPAVFPNYYAYRQKYCAPRFNGFQWVYDGLSNAEELFSKIDGLYIRRTKKQVLKDLPNKVRDMVPIDLTDSKKYEEEKQRILPSLVQSSSIAKEALRALSRTAFDLKKETVVKWIWEFVEEGEKLVVYYYHRAVRMFLEEQFGDEALFIDGSVSGNKKDDIKNRFIQDPEKRLLFGNIESLGTGTDGIQEVCSNCAFIEFLFTPTIMVQAEDRLHRDGQKNSVNVYYLTGIGTVDEDYIKLLGKRAGIFRDVFGEDMVDQIDGIEELLKEYKKDKNGRV